MNRILLLCLAAVLILGLAAPAGASWLPTVAAAQADDCCDSGEDEAPPCGSPGDDCNCPCCPLLGLRTTPQASLLVLAMTPLPGSPLAVPPAVAAPPAPQPPR